jgi:hypothetical protein
MIPPLFLFIPWYSSIPSTPEAVNESDLEILALILSAPSMETRGARPVIGEILDKTAISWRDGGSGAPLVVIGYDVF